MACAPRTIRLDDELERRVRVYCKKNEISINRLVNLAVQKFISEKHVIEMMPLGPEDGEPVLRGCGRKGETDED